MDLKPRMSDAEFTEACTIELYGWRHYVARGCAEALGRVEKGYIDKRQYMADLREARNLPLLTADTTKERIRRELGGMLNRGRPVLP